MSVLRAKLEKNDDYDLLLIEDSSTKSSLAERNLEVWANEDRVIVAKPYSGELHLSDWIDDQIVISLLYLELNGHYKNNLYFLMIFDSEIAMSDNLLWTITGIEKNHRVCRKYVIKSIDDFNRIPSLNERLGGEVDPFDFDTEFKNRLFLAAENQDSGINLSKEIQEMITWYLETYEEIGDERLQQQRQKIEEILGGGSI